VTLIVPPVRVTVPKPAVVPQIQTSRCSRNCPVLLQVPDGIQRPALVASSIPWLVKVPVLLPKLSVAPCVGVDRPLIDMLPLA